MTSAQLLEEAKALTVPIGRMPEIDVSREAAEVGVFAYVLISEGVLGECVEVAMEAECQDEACRLLSVLRALRRALAQQAGRAGTFLFEVRVDDGAGPVRVDLCAEIDDDAETIAITLPGEG